MADAAKKELQIPPEIQLMIDRGQPLTSEALAPYGQDPWDYGQVHGAIILEPAVLKTKLANINEDVKIALAKWFNNITFFRLSVEEIKEHFSKEEMQFMGINQNIINHYYPAEWVKQNLKDIIDLKFDQWEVAGKAHTGDELESAGVPPKIVGYYFIGWKSSNPTVVKNTDLFCKEFDRILRDCKVGYRNALKSDDPFIVSQYEAGIRSRMQTFKQTMAAASREGLLIPSYYQPMMNEFEQGPFAHLERYSAELSSGYY
jgi:hypothetical protein